MSNKDTEDTISALRDQPHPIDRASFWSRVNFSWVIQYIKLCQKVLLEQNMHPELCGIDQTKGNFAILLKRRLRGYGVVKSIISGFGFKFVLLNLITVVDCIVMGGSSLVLYLISSELESEIKEHGRVVNWEYMVMLVTTLVIFSLLRTYLGETGNFERSRMAFRIRTGLSVLIFHKVLKIGLLNPGPIDEGTVTNNLQIDCDRFGSSIWAINSVFYML